MSVSRLMKAVTGCLIILLLAVASSVWLSETRQWRFQVDQWLLEKSPYPASYSSLAMTILPIPAVDVQTLSMRGQRSSGQVYADNIRIRPQFGCWFSETLCGEMIINGLAVDEVLLREIVDDLTQVGKDSRVVFPVSKISISNLIIRLAGGQRLGPYRLDIRFAAPGGAIENILLQRMDKRFSLVLMPTKQGGVFQLAAHEWQLPVAPALVFSGLQARGYWSAKTLVVLALQVQAYQGQIQGGGQLDWQQGINFAAQLAGQNLSLAPIIKVFGGRGVAGSFSANLAVIAQGHDLQTAAGKFFVQGPFEISDGNVRMAARAPLVLKSLSAYGRVNRTGLQLQTVTIDAYDGSLSGTAMVRWHPAWLTQGRLAAENIDAETLLGCFLDRPLLGGRVFGKGRYRLEAATFDGLVDNPDVVADLRIDQGAFYQVDLEKARQGQTNFSTLHSKVRIDQHKRRFSSIELAANRINATGKIAIDEHSVVSGGFDVSLRYTAGLVSFPVTLGGSLADIHVRPAGSALLGGVVGTGVMGPGIGTAIGARIGQFVGGFFEDDPES